MKILDLFSGTGSFSKGFDKHARVVSLDIHPKYNPRICTDILKWNYKMYEPGFFDIIWSSPPCTEYSLAKSVGVRNLKLADAIVKRTLKIIRYLKPKYFFIENPRGLLRYRPFMLNMNKYLKECTYCKYGSIYKKPTDIWTNANIILHKCTYKTPCKHRKKHSTHLGSAQQGSTTKYPHQISHSTETVYQVPPKLIRAIKKQII